MDEGDILSMRRQGFLIFHNYFATEAKLFDTVAAVMKHRLGIEPLQYEVCDK